MKHDHSKNRNVWRAIVHAIAIAGIAMLLAGNAAVAQTGTEGTDDNNTSDKTESGRPRPTIVLVHGAWADGAGWSGVVKRLQARGYTVNVPPNPLRGLTYDAAYIASFLATVQGPIVLVGHSYGGAVITTAAFGNANVKALVYVDGFAPDEGETGLQLISMPPPTGQLASCVGGDPNTTFNLVPYPGAPPNDVDLYIKPEVFPACFANDLPDKEARVLAAAQRPIAFSTLLTPAGPPAWKTIPSWYVLGTLDNVIPPYLQLFMAQRANAKITQIKASHPSMISRPADVADVIRAAARATG